jgi:hypothetical protein
MWVLRSHLKDIFKQARYVVVFPGRQAFCLRDMLDRVPHG